VNWKKSNFFNWFPIWKCQEFTGKTPNRLGKNWLSPEVCSLSSAAFVAAPQVMETKALQPLGRSGWVAEQKSQ